MRCVANKRVSTFEPCPLRCSLRRLFPHACLVVCSCSVIDPARKTCKGVVLDANQQLLALYRAQSAYFASIVVCQFFDAHVCKVRRGVPWGPQFCR